MNKYIDDSFALHTDLYQINMAEAYWEDNMHTKKAIFELHFRKLPLERSTKMIKLFYKNQTRNNKETIHFDQTFSKWIVLICRKMQVHMIFLIKLYYKPTPYSEDPLIKIQVVYLFDAHSFFGFVNLSFQFGTHPLIQHHFFYPVSQFALLFDLCFAFLDVSLCISSPFNMFVINMLKYRENTNDYF